LRHSAATWTMQQEEPIFETGGYLGMSPTNLQEDIFRNLLTIQWHGAGSGALAARPGLDQHKEQEALAAEEGKQSALDHGLVCTQPARKLNCSAPAACSESPGCKCPYLRQLERSSSQNLHLAALFPAVSCVARGPRDRLRRNLRLRSARGANAANPPFLREIEQHAIVRIKTERDAELLHHGTVRRAASWGVAFLGNSFAAPATEEVI